MAVLKYKDSNGNWVPVGGGGGGDTTVLQEEIDRINETLDGATNFRGVYKLKTGGVAPPSDAKPGDWYFLINDEPSNEYCGIWWDTEYVPCYSEVINEYGDCRVTFTAEYADLLKNFEEYSAIGDASFIDTDGFAGVHDTDLDNLTINVTPTSGHDIPTGNTMIRFNGFEIVTENSTIIIKTQYSWEESSSKLGFVTAEKVADIASTLVEEQMGDLQYNISRLDDAVINLGVDKIDRPIIDTIDTSSGAFSTYVLEDTYNTISRYKNPLGTLEFYLSDGSYYNDFITEISFDSGETPTSIVYINSGALNWVGTDCSTVDGYSIFTPASNTHYDIILYFNGTQIIGLVNGFTPAVVESSY